MTARRADGFAYIAAIVFLVVLAGFALAVLRLADTEQVTVNQAVLGARANQAARAGLEWAFFRLKPAGTNCNAVSPNPDLKPATGFVVIVRCQMRTYSEGLDASGAAVSKTIFELAATACNSAGTACNGSSADLANPDYVERRRSASICVASNGTDCY
jgi:MSHA biogenesis protein MshP